MASSGVERARFTLITGAAVGGIPETGTVSKRLERMALDSGGYVPENITGAASLGLMVGAATLYVIGKHEPSGSSVTIPAVAGTAHDMRTAGGHRDVLTTATAHEEPS